MVFNTLFILLRQKWGVFLILGWLFVFVLEWLKGEFVGLFLLVAFC